MLRDPDFLAGRIDTGFVARLMATPSAPEDEPWEIAAAAAAVAAFRERQAARLPAESAGAAPAWWRAGQPGRSAR